MKTNLSEHDYKAFVTEIKAKVYQSQHQALRQVNKQLIGLYWEIGRSIVGRQEKYGWGKSIVASLSKDLQNEFPGVNGFSVQNLWYMRKFYKQYEHFPKLQQSVGEIGWGHNIAIIDKCKSLEESQFYMEMTKKYGWTRDVLIHHIESRSYQQYLNGQTNFDKALPEKYRNQAKLAVKDEYNLEFLELTEQHNEKELELAIMTNMRHFLSEMGGDFAQKNRRFLSEGQTLDISGGALFLTGARPPDIYREPVQAGGGVGEFLCRHFTIPSPTESAGGAGAKSRRIQAGIHG